MSCAEQQPHPSRVHDTLFHGETLLVVAPCDLEDIAFEFGANAIAGDFLAHAAVHEDAEAALLVDFDEFLSAIGGIGDVELHLDVEGRVRQDGRLDWEMCSFACEDWIIQGLGV